MQVLRSVDALQKWRRGIGPEAHVAFVPTMGFLHQGHLSLLEEGRRRVPSDRGHLVLSIFVNPTQFHDPADLRDYPRDEARDLALAEEAGVDVAFCPARPQELYPREAATWVEVEGLDRHLCGATRPGHFRGVCTIVLKLWNLVRPDLGLFGEKDFQQLAILRRMHRDLFLGGEMVGMPTLREADGLAMSSRNARLSAEARSAARSLPRFLGELHREFTAGQRRVGKLLEAAPDSLRADHIDYVEIVDAQNLVPLEPREQIEAPAVCAIAAYYGGVRLIDHIDLDPAPQQ